MPLHAEINIINDKGDVIFKSYCGLGGSSSVMLEEPIINRHGKRIFFGYNFQISCYEQDVLDESLLPNQLKETKSERLLRRIDCEKITKEDD